MFSHLWWVLLSLLDCHGKQNSAWLGVGWVWVPPLRNGSERVEVINLPLLIESAIFQLIGQGPKDHIIFWELKLIQDSIG